VTRAQAALVAGVAAALAAGQVALTVALVRTRRAVPTAQAVAARTILAMLDRDGEPGKVINLSRRR
jgi:hypothetical protein